MLRFLKFLPALFAFKEVAEAYSQETGNTLKPAYFSRRFIGALLTALGGVVAIAFGVVIDPATVDILAGNLEVVAGGVVALYGAVLGVVGLFRKKATSEPLVLGK